MHWDIWIFAYLAFVMIVSSLGAIFSKNPVYTVLLILVMIIHQAFVLWMLGSQFLTAVQIIVYAGAILVLFLFVVYLINLREEPKGRRFIRYLCLGVPVFLAFAFLLAINFAYFLSTKPCLHAYLPINLKQSNVWWIANYLFKYYLLQFELVGVILLVAVLGSVFILRKARSYKVGG